MNTIKALVILSGGQDSTYCLAKAVKIHGADHVAAITFDYGQRHSRELAAAHVVAALLGVTNHEVLRLGGNILKGTSPLTNPDEVLEQYEDFQEMDTIIGDRVEKTFVPMRNALFLNIAANRAVCLGATELYTGVCEQDNANYPDCRLDFILHQQATINQALGLPTFEKPGIVISTPLINKTKAQAIADMIADGSYHLLAFTHTAYDGQYPPVGKDHATLLREQGFVEAGVPDPLMIRAYMEGLLPGRLEDLGPNYANAVDSVLLVDLINKISEDKHALSAMGVIV